MKLSYTDIKNGVVRVNPDDVNTKSNVHQYNREVALYRIEMREAQTVVKGMVVFNLVVITALTLLKSWKLWSFLLVVGVNILLFILREMKVGPLRKKPGYPKFQDMNMIEDDDVPYTPPKQQKDDLDEYLEEMRRQEIRESLGPWTGNDEQQ